jgi:gluconokinase
VTSDRAKRVLRRPFAIVVMGVSGSGKSTLGRSLAELLGTGFLEGDDFHPPENVTKMARAVPLNDSDRAPWLRNLGTTIGLEVRSKSLCVAACSALKRGYRDQLRQAAHVPLFFVSISIDRTTLATRLQRRSNHFMPVGLLDSQLAILEQPGPDEWHLQVDGTSPAGNIAAAVADCLSGADQDEV